MSMSSADVLQFVASGLQNGAIYALMALGFTLVFASTGIINFAQGEFFMLGGMLAAAGMAAGVPLGVSVLAAVAATTLVGCLVERLALRPARSAGGLALVIITIGCSMLIKSGARHLFGPDERALPAFTAGEPLSVGGALIEPQAVWVLVLALAAAVGLTVLYRWTKMGLAMRACSISHDAARIVGVDTARVVMLSFGLAGALGALAGAVVAPITQTAYDVGARMGLKGFAAALLGGLGDPVGAIVGGFVLGLLESGAVAVVSGTYKDAVALVVLLVVLVLRPQGILGRHLGEKL
ncbi:branched-chain amino acid ABC-type transport system, permease components [Coriobacteriaceae bacterium EMTCatB1]|nr:branched-chain amino acid ABC-type transport system, permease components [Coriobacteriaceae bacterium EMTCatB1]